MLPPKAAGTITRIADAGDYKIDVSSRYMQTLYIDTGVCNYMHIYIIECHSCSCTTNTPLKIITHMIIVQQNLS